MSKRFKKAPKRCDHHDFSLKPSASHPPHSHTLHLTLSFCSHPTPSSPTSSPSCPQTPTYNSDRSHASPAFTLQADQSYYKERRIWMLQQHEARFSTYCDEKTQLNVPKPKSKNSYCSVCRLHYEDYLDHITSAPHRHKITTSPFNKYIVQLTNHFKQPAPSQERRPPQQQAVVQEIRDDSDEVQIISNPYKKIKSQTATLRHTTPPTPIHNHSYYPFHQPPTFAPRCSLFQELNHPLQPQLNYLLFNPFAFLPPLAFPDIAVGMPWVCGEWVGMAGGAVGGVGGMGVGERP